MHGNLMYEIARQRMAEQQRAAGQAAEARRQRAAARARRRQGKARERDSIVMPVIPDFPDDLLAAARNAVPAPREEAAAGRSARSAR